MIHIDINIPFYTYGCNERYKLTELIFKHYLNIKEKFKDKAKFTFTLIGSEYNLSKDLALKYFNDEYDTYFEFDQEIYNKDVNFFRMITDKFRFSFKASFNKNPHISLLAGSNDFIDFDFYDQVINSYNCRKKQLFGIDNYKNGNNFVLFLKNYICDELNDNNHFIWNGKYDGVRSIFKYTGGTIGFNNTLYKREYNILLNKIINVDEGDIEFETLKLKNVSKFNSKNTFYLNIKTTSNKELNSYNSLKDCFNNNILKYNILSEEIKSKISNYIYFLNHLI
jgi:hypothetical protein